jgi:hypothetical protein
MRVKFHLLDQTCQNANGNRDETQD